MRTILLPLLATLAACNGAPADTEDTADDAPCVILSSGEYRTTGSCFGMAMDVDLTFDEGTCSFTLDNWSMNMGPTVESGTVDQTSVTLSGNGWEDCTGEVDGEDFSGTCTDGCAWNFGFQG